MARRIAPATAAAEPQNLWETHKRKSIQDAVIRIMCRDGLRSVTMERVAQEVGIAKGTVYLHYRDKQQLLDDVKDSALEPLRAKLEEVVRSSDSAERKLHIYALRYLTYFEEARDLFRILLYEREVTRVQSGRYQSDRYRRNVERVATVIAAGIREKTFRAVDPKLVAAMFVDSIVAIVNQRLLSDPPAPVEEDAALIADVFVRGIANGTAARRRNTR
jgi:AcrR family transcriptional regulator